MLYGEPPQGVAVGEAVTLPLALLAIPVAALVILGLFIPQAMTVLLNRSVASLVP
jgi:hypothetical protein